MKYDNVSCAQCGRNFGPGNSGYSSCGEHTDRDHETSYYQRNGVSTIPGGRMTQDIKHAMATIDLREWLDLKSERDRLRATLQFIKDQCYATQHDEITRLNDIYDAAKAALADKS